MSEPSFAPLAERGVLLIGGPDRQSFLQGLVSNDVRRVAPDRAVYAAFLTAQGKFLHEFCMAALGESLALETEAARIGELQRRLAPYRLRAKVTLTPAGADWACFAAFGRGACAALELTEDAGAARPFAGGVAFVDPRLAALGARLVLPRAAGDAPLREAGLAEASFAAWDRTRLELGVPDGSRDLVLEKSILLEAGFDELNGVDWQKGCYLGQELTARTRYRGLVKKRLLPVTVIGPLPEPGTPVLQDGRDVGEIRSGREGRALAMLRLEALTAPRPLTAGDARVTVSPPPWLRLPQEPAGGAEG